MAIQGDPAAVACRLVQSLRCDRYRWRPTAEEGNASGSGANGGNEQQGSKSVATASGAATVVSSNAPTMVTASGATLLSGLEKSGVTISAEASRALQTHALQIAHSQIVTTSQSPATVTVATSQPQQQQQQQQHSNIILVRGSRSENGQIILQNTHELLSLLSDEDKPIFLQHQRLTTTSGAIKSGTLEGLSGVGGAGGTILLQSDALKKGTTLEVGSSSATGSTTGPIFLQQRLSKNGTEGPILLRTLKRLDKSQSILVIRNATTAGTVATAGSTVVAASAAASGGISVSTAGGATLAKVKPVSTPTTTVVTVTAAPVGSASVGGGAIARRVQEEADEKKEPTVVAKVVHKTNNMPLGAEPYRPNETKPCRKSRFPDCPFYSALSSRGLARGGKKKAKPMDTINTTISAIIFIIVGVIIDTISALAR
uniref:Uncharacterized protein n=1 Tax=Anopheles coluzzii TaxID=1518534 RepID=A0A8W7P5J6_ANOCL